MIKTDQIISPRSAQRVVDYPEFGSGVWELRTGLRTEGGSYSRSPWGFACMQIRGSELANLPWRLVDESGRIVEKHILIDMLRQFGPESNYAEGVQATEIDLLRIGSAYWLRDIDIIKRLNAGTIIPKTDASGISGFEQKVKGKVTNTFKREEVVYFREYHPDLDLAPGVAVMEVAKRPIATEYEAGLYVEAFFKNDATPSLLLSTEQTIQETEMTKLQAWWKKSFKGSKKAHKVAIVDKGLQATKLAHTMKEIAMVEIRDQARNDICVAFRVPKILVGSMVDSTYANAQEARKFMLEDVIIPRSVYYAGVINADLIQKVDPSVRFEFVPHDLPILQEGADEKWKRLDSAVERGAISLEFARAQMGWPETAAPSGTLTPEQTDMRAWRRKAMKSFKSAGSAEVPFETDEIPQGRQSAIRARLSDASTESEVRGAFLDD